MANNDTIDRFDAKWFRHPITGCWIWTASTTPAGYGKVRINGQLRYAHRVAYERHMGPIPEGLELDHLCRVRRCVNPAHLEPVTHRENMLRGEGVGSRCAAVTHCPQGHPYDEANTHRTTTGRRKCRACNRIRAAARRARLGGAA
jgi:hypothetical protein